MKKILTFFTVFSFFFGISQNLVTNGDFSNGTTGWASSGPFSVVGGEAFFSSTNSGGNLWDTQLAQGGMSFTAGVQYTVSFKARAATNRTVEVAIQNVGSWEDQFRQNYNLTTTMQTFSANFSAPFTNGNVQIGFLMAGQGSTAAVYFDDVVVQLAIAPPPPPLTLLQDFETGGLGATFGGASAALEPSPAGPASQVVRLTQNAGEVWQGVNMTFTTNVQLTTNKTMQMDVYSLTPISIAPKVINGLSGAPDSTTSASHGGTGWETLSFTFNQGLDNTVTANGVYAGFVIYYNWNTATNNFGTPDGRVFFVDNLRGTPAPVAPPPSVPMVPAPTPPVRPAADVISIYSDAYANIPVNEWGPNWSPAAATITDFPIDGNETKVINMTTGKDFAGIDFAPSKFDATEFTHFHLDYWMTEPLNPGQIINIKLSNHDGAGETSAIQYLVNPPVVGQWASLDIPLADFGVAVANASRNNIAQIVLSLARANVGSTSAVTYIDNVYFHKNSVTPPPPTEPMVAAPTPPARFPEDVVSIFSDAYANIPVNEWGPNWGPNSTPITDFPIDGNATKVINMGAGQTFAGIDFAPNKFNATPFTHFHIDYWTPEPLNVGQVISIKLSNHDGAGETNAFLYTVTAPTASQWVQIDVPISAFTPVTNSSRANMAQIVITAGRADNGNPVTIYFDNVYFWKAPSTPGNIGVRLDFCNTTLANIGSNVFADAAPNFEEYTFEVTAPDNTVTEIVRPNRWFNLVTSGLNPNYGTTYSVRVKVKIGGNYSNYSTPCTITTPELIVQLRQDFCNQVLASNGSNIFAQSITFAQEYTFEVTSPDMMVTEVVKSGRWFNLMNDGFMPMANETYSVRVKVQVNGVYNAYGTACNVTTPGVPALLNGNMTSLELTTSAYPNPFTNEFTVRLASIDLATVQLFDINGRLIENRQVNDATEITMGQELNAGVYLVRVEQNGEVQSFKMIKK